MGATGRIDESAAAVGYQDWLAEHHQALGDIAAADTVEAVRRATAAAPSGIAERLLMGEQNLVFALGDTDGNALILRFGREGNRFGAEAWALDRAARAGALVPEVLYLGEIGGRPVCVQRRLPGVPLAHLDPAPDPARLQHLVAQAGAILARVHTVEVDSFGQFDAQGHAPEPDGPAHRRHADRPPWLPAMFEGARKIGVPVADLELLLEVLEREAHLDPAPAAAVLAHGDLHPTHVLVDGDTVTGIIDFESCLGESPLYDFAQWQFHWGDHFRTDWLYEGYRTVAEIEDFEFRSHLARARLDLSMVMFYSTIDHPLAWELVRHSVASNAAWAESL